MTGSSNSRRFRALTRIGAALLLSAAASAASGMAALRAAAQTSAPTSSSANGAFPAQPPPAENSNFMYAFGRWWDTARGTLDDLRKQSNSAAAGAASATQDAMRNAAEATKSAATAIVRLPGARFIEVHQRCGIAPNGAPDCHTAAASVCRRKGFRDGHPVDVQSSQDCPPSVWLSGREPKPGECPSETVILLAACD
jgi:hypothetical protein